MEAQLAQEWVERLVNPAPEPEQFDIPDVAEWAEERFYIVEGKRPIQLQPVQKEVLRLFFELRDDGRFKWRTGLYSTIKKSGKTTVAALVQRWAAECWGDYGEIYHMGNKLDQAKDRAYKITRRSIELAPPKERNEWDIQALKMTHDPTKSFIQAYPVNAAGSAGGNQRLTTWTEFHGYVYEEHEKMFTEMQPVPTQPLSFRFVESYAGYDGESLLLWNLWDLAMSEGELLHDKYPIYGVPSAGLIAYIDVGEAARRMPWQRGPLGAEYYEAQAKVEQPLEYKRIHFNEWVGSTESFVEKAVWESLIDEVNPPQGRVGLVASADASLSKDCTAAALGYMDGDIFNLLEIAIFTPPKDQRIDYDETIKPILEAWFKLYWVRHVVYDDYQLHDVMTGLGKKYKRIEFEAFPQGDLRIKADTALRNRIWEGKLRHEGNEELTSHVQNALAKASAQEKGVRIVKKPTNKPIDGLVALSMAAYKASEPQAEKGTARKAKAKIHHKRR
jgi:phage terminase large subunit-like protein